MSDDLNRDDPHPDWPERLQAIADAYSDVDPVLLTGVVRDGRACASPSMT